ncbi:MAG: zinc-finger domain-containing protein [Alphaproteobacteria bacterium]|nr:zinc-finger domain-containing protein [Alphaproteobacteria bacterium]
MTISIQPTETKSAVVKCDGGSGPLGHPVIYLHVGKEGKIVCPYCSKYFVKKACPAKKGW